MSQEVYGFEPLKSVYARVGQLLESRHIAQTTVTTIMQKTAGTETETLQLEYSEDANSARNEDNGMTVISIDLGELQRAALSLKWFKMVISPFLLI
jgi:hypothetical protein